MSSEPRRYPSTKRGAATYETLLRAGASVFGRQGFRQASVAEVCRRSRVANGTFYQYFPDKEHIFLKLIERMANQLQARLETGADKAQAALGKIQSALRAHLDFIGSQTALYRVFREAEFIQTDLPQQLYGRLAHFYQRMLRAGQSSNQLRPLHAETVAFSLLGMTEFIALRYLFWDRGLPPEAWATLRDFVARGISGDQPFVKTARVIRPFLEEQPPPLSQGQRTRARLLSAAEAEFGRQGFYEAHIVDIARRAGVAHGTFYTYFPSKEAIFVELIREINRQLRAHSRGAGEGLQDRREIERAGFQAFFDFIQKHPQAYRIVREAEFVGPPSNTAGRWYYERLAQGYAPAVSQAMTTGQIRQQLYPEALVYALMGIGHFIGLRWIVWEGQAVPARVFETMMDFILNGLQPT